jgi:hypothetical protein
MPAEAPDEAPAPTRANGGVPSAVVILGVALTGGALRWVASALSIRWLYHVGSGLAVVGAIVFVLYVWWRLYIGSSEPPEPQQDEHSPH